MRLKDLRGLAIAPFFLLNVNCSITAVRPSQEMSDMEVSLKAAKEVNADVLAPELYRVAQETGLRARREYRYKNFQDAKKLADEARTLAERAEFESLKNGAKREAVPTDPLSEPSYPPEVIGTPNPTGSPSANGSSTGAPSTNPKTPMPTTPR